MNNLTTIASLPRSGGAGMEPKPEINRRPKCPPECGVCQSIAFRKALAEVQRRNEVYDPPTPVLRNNTVGGIATSAQMSAAIAHMARMFAGARNYGGPLR